jgi:23S rRNA pseudouridine1911/1915/1917 synthase
VPRFVVAGSEAGERVDSLLARRSGLSRARAQRLLALGLASVDGVPARKDLHAREGMVVEYEDEPTAPSSLVAEDLAIPVVYEDAALLVIDKPAGMVVHPAAGHDEGTVVHGLIAEGLAGGHDRRPGVVHRLDKDTSGLMVLARDERAYAALVALMAARRISREYVALLCGDLPQDEGTIDAPIGRHVRDRQRMSVHTSQPRRAVTHFSVARRLDGYTLVDVRLETGRTHQIRVHFSALGYPVAGDVVYGARGRPDGLTRQFLHARRLSFPHPLDQGRELTFESPLPPDLAAFLASLRPA